MVVTTQQMIDRTRRTYYNNYPSDESVITDNEILLFINDAVASIISKQTNEHYSITGIMQVPDGYISTIQITSLTKDSDTGYYKASIPHPPMGLPGDSGIQSCFFVGTKGPSKPVIHVSANEVDFFRFMPMPPQAAFYWIEGTTLYLYVKTTLPTSVKLNLRMATMVTSNLNVPINVPPDAIDTLYTMVLAKLIQRKNIISDEVSDGKDRV
jgi:hypothetical protein